VQEQSRQIAALERDNQRLRQQVQSLDEALQRTRRAGKRQAAPFSKGKLKKRPKRPGRKPGAAYGKKARRAVPSRVDEVVEAELPAQCPDCGGQVEHTDVQQQYQTDIPPVQPHVTQFNVHIGHCSGCGKRVQGRHSGQCSDALGAAASQLGTRVLGLAAEFNKGLGLSYVKTCQLFNCAFGLQVTPGGLCLALHRVADTAEPTYQALCHSVRSAAVVAPDETGWKVGGSLQWLWVFATAEFTVYAILPGRGFEQAASILGEDFAGVLERDGWAPYRRFEQATHQSCLAHLLRRCGELLETAQRGAARVPWAVKRILQNALVLRDRRDRDELSPHGLLVAIGRLEARTDRLLAWRPTDDNNRKLLKHLHNEREALFTFLKDPQVEATNWRAEQAIRPAVVTRKVFGGNRTWKGARTQQILASVLRTCKQQSRDALGLFAEMLRQDQPQNLASAILGRARSP
jgi:transposase